MLPKVVLVHCFEPAVEAVALNVITTRPPGFTAFWPLAFWNLRKPAGAVMSWVQVSDPGLLVAVTPMLLGVPAPAGIATWIEAKLGVPTGDVLVTVSV